MKLDVHDLGCDMYSASPHKWLQATKGTGFLYVRDEVIDRVWNTIATEGWDDTKLRAERFQRIGSSNVPTLCGLRAAIEFANQIGIERIEKAPPADGGLYFGRVSQAGSDFMDIAERSAALRNRHRKCSSREAHGIGKLAVERRRKSAFAAESHRSYGFPCRTLCCARMRIGFSQRLTNTKRSWLEDISAHNLRPPRVCPKHLPPIPSAPHFFPCSTCKRYVRSKTSCTPR